MTKEEVIQKLQDLSIKLHTPMLRQKDIRGVKGLEYYVSIHFRNLADALKAAGLEPTPLAEKMSTSKEELLQYLINLGKKLGKRPTVIEIKKDGRFSERIFQKRFGGIKQGYEKALKELKQAPKETVPEELETVEFPNKGLFSGRAAEAYIIAELMYRGYNSAPLPVDLGIDVVAVKQSKTFYFQVKNVSFNKSNGRRVPITTSSFLNNQSASVFYAFVLQLGQKKQVLMLPFFKIRELMNNGTIQIDKESKEFMVNITWNNDIVQLISTDKTKSIDLSNYLNDWGVII